MGAHNSADWGGPISFGSSSRGWGGGWSWTVDDILAMIDKQSTEQQIKTILSWQDLAKQHPQPSASQEDQATAKKWQNGLSTRLAAAQQKLADEQAETQRKALQQLTAQQGATAPATHGFGRLDQGRGTRERLQQKLAQQQAETAHQQAVAERARQAEIARIAEAAAQAAAENALEETARLTAEAAVAERSVQAVKEQITQLEAQLITAQAATQDALQLKSTCAAQRAEAEGILDTANKRVEQTLAHYMPLQEKAEKNTAIRVAELKKMNAAPFVNWSIKTPELLAAEKQLKDSAPLRMAAGLAAEHAKLQHMTAVELQKSIDELTHLSHQQATIRASAEEQTRLAVERVTETAASLTGQQVTAQRAAEAAMNQLKAVAHRLSSQQQTAAKQRAEATAQSTAKPMLTEVPVSEALSRQFMELTTRLASTQEKIEQIKEALQRITAMEPEAKEAETQQKYPFMVAYPTILRTLMREYLVTKELAELRLENDPVADIVAQDLARVTEAKLAMHPLKKLDPRSEQKAGASYYAELTFAYCRSMQRKADKLVQQTERDVAALSSQQAEAIITRQHLTETGANQTEIDTLTNRLAELTTRLTAAQKQEQAAHEEKEQLAKQHVFAKYEADRNFDYFAEVFALNKIEARQGVEKSPFFLQGELEARWKQRYGVAAFDTLTPRLGNGLEDGFFNYQAAIQKAKERASDTYSTIASAPSFQSLELLFKYGFDSLISDDDHALHLDDKSLNLATRLFMWDLLSIMVYHAPSLHHLPHIEIQFGQSLLRYMQYFFDKHPERYQTARSRMSKRLQPELDSSPPFTSKFDATIGDLSGWKTAEAARTILHMKATLAQKTNQRFFTVIPEPREQFHITHATETAQKDAEFSAFVDRLETIADKVNLLDLPADILEKLKTISATLHETETVHSTRPK